MSRSLKVLLVLVMVLAVALPAILWMDFLRDRRALRGLEEQLAESRANWESIAKKKEELQESLQSTEEALKEARLTLQESTERAEALRSDIEALKSELALAEP